MIEWLELRVVQRGDPTAERVRVQAPDDGDCVDRVLSLLPDVPRCQQTVREPVGETRGRSRRRGGPRQRRGSGIWEFQWISEAASRWTISVGLDTL